MESNAFLAGFDARVSEVEDRLRLCQPILTFGDDDCMYLARRLDWSRQDEVTGRSLTSVDHDDIATFGTVVSAEARMPIEPGTGVLIVGGAFFDAVRGLGDDPWDEVTLNLLDGNSCLIGLADVEQFDQIKTRIGKDAARAVDDELGKALAGNEGMSSRGKSASHVLRKCGRRRTDLAVRELAVALVDRELDLFRRRLSRYSIELGESRDALEEGARRHLRLAECNSRYTNASELAIPQFVTAEYLEDTLGLGTMIVEAVGESMASMKETLNPATTRKNLGEQLGEHFGRLEKAVAEIGRLRDEMEYRSNP